MSIPKMIDHAKPKAKVTSTGHPEFLEKAPLRTIYELPMFEEDETVRYTKLPRDDTRNGVLIDVETTGLDFDDDEIIEVCALPFRFDSDTLEIVDVQPPFVQRQQPKKRISSLITRVTGLSNEGVRGENIDWDEFGRIYDESTVVLAHNARFDRKMVEKTRGASDKLWACTVHDIDWDLVSQGASRKLDYLCMLHGFTFDHHRAENDCRATLHLVAHPDKFTGRGSTYFESLIRIATSPRVRVKAFNSPIAKKDVLRERGYRFSWHEKVWEIDVAPEDVDLEADWLSEHMYDGGRAHAAVKVDPMRRYSE